MRGKKSTHRGVYTRRRAHGESTHGGVHTEESTQEELYTRGEHKWEEHTRKRAHMEESCPHRGESVHTQEYTRKRAHTKECTHGESTRRSIHGESAHGGVHTGGAHTGRAHLEEYTQRSTHGGSKHGESTHGESDMEEYSSVSTPSTPSCEVSFISSSIELQWAKFSDGIFYAIVSV